MAKQANAHILNRKKNLILPQIYAPCCIWQSSPFIPSLVQLPLPPAVVRHSMGRARMLGGMLEGLWKGARRLDFVNCPAEKNRHNLTLKLTEKYLVLF